MYISSRHLSLLNKLIDINKDTDNPVFTVNRISNNCELRGYVHFSDITITLKKLSELSMFDCYFTFCKKASYVSSIPCYFRNGYFCKSKNYYNC